MKHVTANLAAYRAGELSPPVEIRVKEHLDSCAACRQELEKLTSLWHLLGEAAEPEPASGSVWSQVRSRTTAPSTQVWPTVGWGMAALVAGVLLGAALPGSAPLPGGDEMALTTDTDDSWLDSSWLQTGQSDDLASGWLLAGDPMTGGGS